MGAEAAVKLVQVHAGKEFPDTEHFREGTELIKRKRAGIMWAQQAHWANLLADQGKLTVFVGEQPIFIASRQKKVSCFQEGWS